MIRKDDSGILVGAPLENKVNQWDVSDFGMALGASLNLDNPPADRPILRLARPSPRPCGNPSEESR